MFRTEMPCMDLRLLVLIPFIFVQVSCVGDTVRPEASPDVTISEPKTESSSEVQIPSDQELRAIGERLSQALENSNVDELEEIWDETSFRKKVIARTPSGSFYLPQMVSGLLSGGESSGPFYSYLQMQTRFLGTRHKSGESRVLVRGDSESGATVYLECVIERVGGETKVVDVYFDFGEESMSETTVEMAEILKSDKSGASSELFNLMVKFAEAEDREKALAVYSDLPDKLKSMDFLKRHQLGILTQLGRAEYVEGLRDYLKSQPPDRTPTQTHLNAYYYTEDYDRLLIAVRELKDRFKMENAALDGLEAIALSRTGQPSEGIKACRDALRKEPEYEAIYWVAVDVAVRAKDFRLVAQSLDYLSQKYPEVSKEVERREELNDFRNSAIGKEWLAKARP